MIKDGMRSGPAVTMTSAINTQLCRQASMPRGHRQGAHPVLGVSQPAQSDFDDVFCDDNILAILHCGFSSPQQAFKGTLNP